ncbi:MAG TPA: hypothetical protein VES95_02125 [Dermatophilaceae bacterium]|nr:hypothetical protein [Dermatophilaceae bacterium]
MSWWSRRRAKDAGGRGEPPAVDLAAVRAHLADFAASRRGVEAYVEPATHVTSTTVVLIAHDGEWTRRAVPGRPQAFELARGLGVPTYDVNQTGYPSRMREWNSRQRRRAR